MADALAPLVDADTLVVESTDFSHYLPQHEARRFDQQTLNVLASGSLDGDRRAAPARTMPIRSARSTSRRSCRRQLFGAAPLVIANENSQQYASDYVAETTSYMVILFGRFGPGYNDPPLRRGEDIYYFAGDTNFGRAMKKVLLDEEVRRPHRRRDPGPHARRGR